MNILVVSATKEELKTLNNIEVLITGVGIPNTIFKLTNHLNNYKYDLIINIGICGSFKNTYDIGNVVEIIRDEFSEIGYEDGDLFFSLDKKFGINTIFNVPSSTNLPKVHAITVNTVHGSISSIERVVNQLNPDVESMEGAACFMVCQYFDTPCIQIRAVSNKVEERDISKWNIPLAVNNLNVALEKIIKGL
tara:strand:- start:599 stop:1174 length:576 start_codon:yes stop_codon:yes gene_type:complete